MSKRLHLFLFIGIISFTNCLQAQNVGINIDNSNPDPSAMLDIKSTNKGILVPRMTTAQRTAIGSPATGLMVFDNTSNTFWFFNGTVWVQMLAGTDNDNQDLSLAGNTLSLTGDGTTVDLSAFLDADNLGNHTATTNLNMAANNINAANNITATGAVSAANDFYGRINVQDTRATNDAPNTYDREVHFEFKQRAAVGVPGAGTYSGLMTIAPWSDNSGNLHHQLNFNDGGIYYRTGQPDAAAWGSWTKLLLTGDVNPWSLTGNSGTNPATNFLGSTDAADLAIRTANTERMRIMSGGNVGIGITAANNKLDIAAAARSGTHATGLPLYVTGSLAPNANGIEFRHDNGTQGIGFGYNTIYATGANANQDLGMASRGTGHLIYSTNSAERMRIEGASGNVGIGIAAPTQRLDVQGGNARINNTFIGDVGHGVNWAGFAHQNQVSTTGYAYLASTDGAYTLINKQNTGSGYIGFRVANADVAVITNAGNMGIGTLAPANRLSVSGSVQAIDVYAAGGQNILVGDDAFFSDMDVAHRTGLISTSNATLGELQLGNSGTNPVLSGNPGFLSVSQEMRVQTTTNRFRRSNTGIQWSDQFDPGGLSGVHIGNNEIEEGGFWANGNYAMIYSPGDNDLVKIIDEDYLDNAGTMYDNNAMRARIDFNGQYFQISDAKSKDKIKVIPNSLSKLTSLNGYTYEFKLLDSEIAKGQKPMMAAGVLAQEVEKVLPEAVSSYEGNYMVNYAAFVPLFIEAIKEQQATIEKQKEQISAYEAKQDAMLKEMAEIKEMLRTLQK